MKKEFDLETVLTITSGRLFTNMNNLYMILQYMFSEDLHQHHLSRALEDGREHILSIYPQLEGVGEDLIINNNRDIQNFIIKQKEIYGENLTITPIANTKEECCSKTMTGRTR